MLDLWKSAIVRNSKSNSLKKRQSKMNKIKEMGATKGVISFGFNPSPINRYRPKLWQRGGEREVV